MDRRYRDLKKLAKKYQRKMEFSGSSHIHLKHPKYRLVVASCSPGNVDNWLKEVERELRQAQRV